jgi:D-erythronate 2-dehydrogenase
MSHVLVTGANGYIGRSLSDRLKGRLQAGQIESLTLVDMRCDEKGGAPAGNGLRYVGGDLGEAAVLARATEVAPDVVFHLAGITSRQSEDDFQLGLQVNVLNTIALFERLRTQGRRPVVVFASSIAVYGPPLPAFIDDQTPPAPVLSYGTQKRAVEILLADYCRRGWLDGRSVRLPSVVARPAVADGALSAFASDLVRELALGRRYTCPIVPDGTLWLISLPACVDNLLHAADVAADRLPAARAWNLPALRASAAEMVACLCGFFGPGLARRIDYRPVPSLQPQFAQWPLLRTPTADALGFKPDPDLDTLIEHALRGQFPSTASSDHHHP